MSFGASLLEIVAPETAQAEVIERAGSAERFRQNMVNRGQSNPEMSGSIHTTYGRVWLHGVATLHGCGSYLFHRFGSAQQNRFTGLQ